MNPPVEPELEDCCSSGCVPCVFDLYAQAVERYEAWLATQPESDGCRRFAALPETTSRERGNPISGAQPESQTGFPRPRE